MSSTLKNILAFANLGIPILPLARGSDQPAVAGKAKVTDPKTLRRLYQRYPDYNYGLMTDGEFFAVSVEGDDAKSRFRMMSSGNGDRASDTVTLKIGKRQYFLFRARGMKVPSGQNKLGDGINIYGEGEFVLGPGSKLDSGIKSRFAENKGLDDTEVLKCPKRLWGEIIAAPREGKEATEAELLNLAKTEIERGENSWRKAAEVLAKAEKEFGTSQREMAEAIGRSASWVNHLLQWHRSGCKAGSPFGPTTKAGRVAHAKQRAGSSRKRKGKSSPPVAGSAGSGVGNTELRAQHSHGSASAIPKTRAAEIAYSDRSPTPEATAQLEHLQAELATATERVRHLEEELSSAHSHSAFESADLPAFLDRRVLSPEEKGAFDAIKQAFEASPEFVAAWALASLLVRHRFVRDVLLAEAVS